MGEGGGNASVRAGGAHQMNDCYGDSVPAIFVIWATFGDFNTAWSGCLISIYLRKLHKREHYMLVELEQVLLQWIAIDKLESLALKA